MMEANCTRCHETFIPGGTDPEDLIHGPKNDGAGPNCGGIGIITGEWVIPTHKLETYQHTWGRMVNLSPQEVHGLEHPDCDDPDCEFHFPILANPPVINAPIDDAVMALIAFSKDANAKTHREAQKAYALVDWVEPEVDPRTLQGKYLEMVYQFGETLGFQDYDKLTEREKQLLDI